MARKNTVNFAQTIITAPSSGITTLVGTVGTSDSFPATNFYATIQQVVAGEIIKKEVVLCSTRTGTTFAVTRGQDGTSAQDFTTGGGVIYLVIATASAHIQDIWDKLDTVDTDILTANAKPATGKTPPVDADSMRLWDSVASNVKKFVTWANIKATLKDYFDTLYHPINALRTGLTATRLLSTNGSGVETYIAPGSVGQFLKHDFTFGNITGIRTRVIKTNTTQRTSTTTMVSDPELTFNMINNTKYMIRGFIIFEANIAPDIKIGYTGPASPVLGKIQRAHVVPGSPTAQVFGIDDINTITTIACTTGSYGFINFNAIIHNGVNDGTFAFQWAQNTSDPNITQVLAGSFMEYISY